MVASFVVYCCGVVLLIGLALAVKPAVRLRVTRRRAFAVALLSLLFAIAALLAPAFEARAVNETHLDRLTPIWQFRELHTRRVAAPPERVFDAILKVRADEISLFHTLTWIRRGGRSAPPSILNAGSSESIIDVATRTTFLRLAHDPPRELVLGTVVVAPEGFRRQSTATLFREAPPPGFALAAMNFKVVPDGPGASIVSTETRVFATSAGARRRFAAYWRLIYPGSAIIRRMWLRAIERRALML